MNPTENLTNTEFRAATPHSDSDILSAEEVDRGLRPYIPPLMLPNGRPSLVRTFSQIELSSRSDSPHTPPSIAHTSSPKGSPLRPPFDKLPMCASNSTAKKIDKGLKKFLRMKMKTMNPTLVSASLLASKVDIVARYEVEKRFKDSQNPSISSKELIFYIQHSGILSSNIQRRLQILADNIESYVCLHGHRTHQLHTLRTSLQSLIATCDDLVQFTKLIEKHRKVSNKTEKLQWEVISMALEDDRGKIEPVLTLLNLWANPTDFEFDQLHTHIEQVTRIQSIPGLRVVWTEDENEEHPIDTIPVNDAVRSMCPGDTVLMNSISINDETFYNDEKASDFKSQEDFFKALFTALNRAGFAEKRQRDIDRDVTTFFTAARIRTEELEEFLKSHPLPILELLRPYTMNSWGHADQIIRNNFSGIFEAPYCTKLQQGVNCSFNIKDPLDWTVSVEKSYKIFYRIPSKSFESFPMPDLNRMLCRISFEWSLKKNKGFWNGQLMVNKIEWSSSTPWEDQKLIAEAFLPKTAKENNVALAATSNESQTDFEARRNSRTNTPRFSGSRDRIDHKK